MSADGERDEEEAEYPPWFIAWLKSMGYNDPSQIGLPPQPPNEDDLTWRRWVPLAGAAYAPYEAPTYDPFAQWGARVGEYGFLMRSLAPLYAASIFRQFEAIPQYAELAGIYGQQANYFAARAAFHGMRGDYENVPTDIFRVYRSLAHGAYYDFRATAGAPAGLLSSTFKLASFTFPPGTGLGTAGVAWRALGWPFFGAYGDVGAAAAMAPYVQQMYQMFPGYTQGLITGAPAQPPRGMKAYPWTGPGFLYPYAYPTMEEAFVSGGLQWSAAQVGAWSALAGVEARLAGESARQAIQQTVTGTMGMSLFQWGLGISVPIIARRTGRAISGLPEFFTPQEQQMVYLQFGAGIGLQAGGVAWQAFVAPRFAPSVGLLGGVKVYGPGDLMWQWATELNAQGIRAALTGGRVAAGLGFGPLEAAKFAEAGLKMSWSPELTRLQLPLGRAATPIDISGLVFERPFMIESAEYWAAKSGRYWGGMADYLQRIYGFPTGMARPFARSTLYGPSDLMWNQGWGPEPGAISGRVLPRPRGTYGPLAAEKYGEAGLKIRLMPEVWQPSILARGLTVGAGVAGAYGLSELLGRLGARVSPEAEFAGYLTGAVGGYLGAAAWAAWVTRTMGMGVTRVAAPALGLGALLGPLSAALIAGQIYAEIEAPQAIVKRWEWALANPLTPMPPTMRYTAAGLAPPGVGIPMNVQAWEASQIQAWQAANLWTPMPPTMRYAGQGLAPMPTPVDVRGLLARYGEIYQGFMTQPWSAYYDYIPPSGRLGPRVYAGSRWQPMPAEGLEPYVPYPAWSWNYQYPGMAAPVYAGMRGPVEQPWWPMKTIFTQAPHPTVAYRVPDWNYEYQYPGMAAPVTYGYRYPEPGMWPTEVAWYGKTGYTRNVYPQYQYPGMKEPVTYGTRWISPWTGAAPSAPSQEPFGPYTYWQDSNLMRAGVGGWTIDISTGQLVAPETGARGAFDEARRTLEYAGYNVREQEAALGVAYPTMSEEMRDYLVRRRFHKGGGGGAAERSEYWKKMMSTERGVAELYLRGMYEIGYPEHYLGRPHDPTLPMGFTEAEVRQVLGGGVSYLWILAKVALEAGQRRQARVQWETERDYAAGRISRNEYLFRIGQQPVRGVSTARRPVTGPVSYSDWIIGLAALGGDIPLQTRPAGQAGVAAANAEYMVRAARRGLPGGYELFEDWESMRGLISAGLSGAVTYGDVYDRTYTSSSYTGGQTYRGQYTTRLPTSTAKYARSPEEVRAIWRGAVEKQRYSGYISLAGWLHRTRGWSVSYAQMMIKRWRGQEPWPSGGGGGELEYWGIPQRYLGTLDKHTQYGGLLWLLTDLPV